MATRQGIARRLKESRENRGLTQAHVAQVLCLPRSALSQIESASRAVSSLELADLARIYGEDVGYFLADHGPAHSSSDWGVHLRADEVLPPDVRAVEQCMRLCKLQCEMEAMLGRHDRSRVPPFYPLAEPRSIWQAIREGEAVAEQERVRLGLGVSPLRELAEAVELLQMEGLRVLTRSFRTGSVSGITICREGKPSAIILNRSHRPTRLRFTLAHEYMHVLGDRFRGTIVSTLANSKTLIEVRANAFGAAFLLPAQGVARLVQSLGRAEPSRSTIGVASSTGAIAGERRRLAGSESLSLSDVLLIEKHFGTSHQATLFRLQNLGYLTEEQRLALDSAQARARATGIACRLGIQAPERENERVPRLDGFFQRFVKTAVDVYLARHISRDKLMGLLAEVSIRGREATALLRDLGVGGEEPEDRVLAP